MLKVQTALQSQTLGRNLQGSRADRVDRVNSTRNQRTAHDILVREFSLGRQHGVMGSLEREGTDWAGCIDDGTCSIGYFSSFLFEWNKMGHRYGIGKEWEFSYDDIDWMWDALDWVIMLLVSRLWKQWMDRREFCMFSRETRWLRYDFMMESKWCMAYLRKGFCAYSLSTLG
jgi:hypothetical protein